MFSRMGLCFVFACLLLVLTDASARAQGTVTWVTGYPGKVDTVLGPPPQLGKITFKLTHQPTAGWFFGGAGATIVNNAGGPAIPGPTLEEKNGDIGKLVAGNIQEYVFDNVQKGTYTVYVTVSFINNAGNRQPVTSSVVTVTIN